MDFFLQKVQWCLGCLRTSLIGPFPLGNWSEVTWPGPANSSTAQPSCPNTEVRQFTWHVGLSFQQKTKDYGPKDCDNKGKIPLLLLAGETFKYFLQTKFTNSHSYGLDSKKWEEEFHGGPSASKKEWRILTKCVVFWCRTSLRISMNLVKISNLYLQ